MFTAPRKSSRALREGALQVEDQGLKLPLSKLQRSLGHPTPWPALPATCPRATAPPPRCDRPDAAASPPLPAREV